MHPGSRGGPSCCLCTGFAIPPRTTPPPILASQRVMARVCEGLQVPHGSHGGGGSVPARSASSSGVILPVNVSFASAVSEASTLVPSNT